MVLLLIVVVLNTQCIILWLIYSLLLVVTSSSAICLSVYDMIYAVALHEIEDNALLLLPSPPLPCFCGVKLISSLFKHIITPKGLVTPNGKN